MDINGEINKLFKYIELKSKDLQIKEQYLEEN